MTRDTVPNQDDIFPVPRVVGALPDLPGEVNLIPIELLDMPLRVEFDDWGSSPIHPPYFPSTASLYWDGNVVASKYYEADGFDPDQLFLEVPAHLLVVSGVHELYYRINGLGYDDNSFKTTVLIDLLPPSFNLRPADVRVPAEVLTGGLTQAWLDSNNNQLTLTIPHYTGTRQGDQILLYWESSPSQPGDDIPIFTRIVTRQEADNAQGDITAEIPVVLPQALIQGRGNGLKGLWYELKDRAGNTSSSSHTVVIGVTLPAPPALQQPEVPAFADGVINRADAYRGVSVQVRNFAWEPNDVLIMHWGAVDIRYPVPQVPLFPLDVPVEWEVLTVGDGFKVRHNVIVTYTLERGSNRWQSPPLTVTVDMTVAGPPNPSINPINPVLPLVTVRGVTGDNVITLADANQPVRVEVLLYANPQPGEELDLFWGGQVGDAPVATYIVQTGDAEGKLIVFAVPWADVLVGGDGLAVPVRYTTFNGINGQQCQDTFCRVEVAVEDPTLPVPFYPDPRPPKDLEPLAAVDPLNPLDLPDVSAPSKPKEEPNEVWNPAIGNYNCAARPWNGVVIKIPASRRFVANSRIVLNWRGYTTSNLAESSFLPGTQYQKDHLVTAATAGQEVSFTIYPADFRRCILPTSYRGQGAGERTQGSGYAYYTLYSPGLPAVYNQHKQSYCRIDLIRSGLHCPCSWDGYPTEEEDWCLDCDPITDQTCEPQP